MFSRTLCWAVGIVNAHPPFMAKAEFYAIKNRLLRRYAEQDGHDIQHIRKSCWTCNGTGIYDIRYSEPCCRCRGTGTYEQFWVQLERWRWHGRVFHRPARRLYEAPLEPVAIEGYVEHAPVNSRLASELALWLLLVFAMRTGLRALQVSYSCRPWPYPLLTLQWLWCAVAWRFPTRRKCNCGKAFIHWPGKALWLVCPACRKAAVARAAATDDDDGIPF